MLRSIIIVGGGPRGLAVAIEALPYIDQIYIVDSKPGATWSATSTVADFELRSPVSFDLVTYSANNRHYSLSNYLYTEDMFTTDQLAIETDPRRIKRSQMFGYLCWVKQKLQQEGVQFLYDDVLDIRDGQVHLKQGAIITADNIVLAQGTKERDTPSYLLPYKPVSNLDILNKDYGRLLIVGSGQGAFDIAHYLHSKGVDIGIYITKLPKIHQYPAPSYNIWGPRTALGVYCNCLSSVEAKKRYIASVKAWGPSITPNNEYLLSSVPIYRDVPIEEVMIKYDYRYVNRTGVVPINTLSIRPDEVDRDGRVLNSQIYVTGPLAILSDGPRVNSIISSSTAAQTIVRSIINASI